MTNLTEDEIEFVKSIQNEHDGFAMLKLDVEDSDRVQKLQRLGYVRKADALSGPTGVKTGHKGLVLTEAGRIALNVITDVD